MKKKKLIEVALPLDAINEQAAYEKMPGIGPHPRGLHLWWARRPFTCARAVIWASLVDDPSSHPEQFPTDEAQNAERQRLFGILKKLIEWKNSNNPDVLKEAKAEILKSTDGNPPALLDPFAGGGAIPLEAQRLGLEAHAHDLNPVAVMINKAMIEIPPRFADKPPVNPNSMRIDGSFCGAMGLAEDVRCYGEWMKQEAFRRIGHLYPKVQIPHEQGGGEATVIAWIWARTVPCPNPTCRCDMPLVSSFVLSKKKGNEAWIEQKYENGKFKFTVRNGNYDKNIEYGTKYINDKGKARKGMFKCPLCSTSVSSDYIDGEATKGGGLGVYPLAIVAEGQRGRIYLSVDEAEYIQTSNNVMDYYERNDIYYEVPHEKTRGTFASNAQGGYYGFFEFKDYFTKRQLIALTTFSDILNEVQDKAEHDAVLAGMPDDHVSLADGGSGALAYGQAVRVYLAFAIDRLADFSTSVSRWSVSNEKAMNCFSKQAIPMTWDFPEVNIMGNSVGSMSQIVNYITDCIKKIPETNTVGTAKQQNAKVDCNLRNIIVSTDPPYYDNIGYADLSDFFYVWLRKNLKDVYPSLFGTLLVPKNDELIASPYRHSGSKKEAKEFFENGMFETCQQIYRYASEDIPVTIYYAYKQSDTDEKNDTQASTGWETMLNAVIKSGFSITGTWPMRTEQAYRSISMGTNALASSIVLVCRKRSENAPDCTRRGFINELKRELKTALKNLQSSNIAPVDMAQSAIGPGIAVFSRYRNVLESDGTPMTVRSALQIINQELDVYFNEQGDELDSESRFCVALYQQCGFDYMKFGDANTLANAKNTSVAAMEKQGIVVAQKGLVHLTDRCDLPEKINEKDATIWQMCQHLTYIMEKKGIEGCSEALSHMMGTKAEAAKDLAYHLYTIAERKKWTKEAYDYNALVISWAEIKEKAAQLKNDSNESEQLTLF